MIKQILVIDDDHWFLKIIIPILQNNGFETSSALGGEEALKKLETEIPDLILLDVMMPGNSSNYLRSLAISVQTRQSVIITYNIAYGNYPHPL